MAAYTITTRSGYGSAILHALVDDNFTAVSDIITALGLTDSDSTITFPAKVLAPQMFITEAAAAAADVAAQGQFWVLNSTPNVPVFTDDAGTDAYLLTIDAATDGHVVLPQTADAVTPTLAFGDGDTGFYEAVDDALKIAIAGVAIWDIDATVIASGTTSGGVLKAAAASSTVPALTFTGDTNTGVGTSGADSLSLITGGVEAVSINSGQDITKMNFKKYSEKSVVNATATGAVTLNMDNGPIHDVTLTGNVTFTFSNPVATGNSTSMTILATQDATGGRSITWPASVVWDSGVAPTLTTTANAVSMLAFLTIDGGTTWYGFESGDNFS